jgi:hypothetical protein
LSHSSETSRRHHRLGRLGGVDENTLYRVTSGSGESLVRLGSELIEGVSLEPMTPQCQGLLEGQP